MDPKNTDGILVLNLSPAAFTRKLYDYKNVRENFFWRIAILIYLRRKKASHALIYSYPITGAKFHETIEKAKLFKT